VVKQHYQEMLPYELEQVLSNAPVAYWPLGTLEYHGPHLPIGNDALKAEGILERVCSRTGGVIVPALYWGIGGGHKAYPTSVIVHDETLSALLGDVLAGLVRVGFRVLVLLTGHYPGEQVQAVKGAVERLLRTHPEVRAWALPEYEAFPDERRADHAARWETSILMHIRPDLVDIGRLVGADAPGAPDATHTLEEMNAEGPLHGLLGQNPARYASPAAGQETVEVIVENLVVWVKQSLALLGYA